MNRPRVAFVFVFLALTPIAASAQQGPGAPSKTNTTPAAPKQAAANYSQEPFVIEQYSTVARFENDGTGEHDLTVRIHVQSDAGVQQLGELVFGYNSSNEQMDVHYVRVHKPDGTVVTAAPDAIKELTATVARDAPVYTDYKEKHITVPSLRPGDTLEYDIATRLVTPLAPNQFWYEHNFLEGTIVLDERLELNVPAGRTINLRSPDFNFEKTEANARTIYRWNRANLARPSEEEESKKKIKRPEPKPPAVQLTTFASWEDVARWYANLEHDRIQPSPEVSAKVQELIRGRAGELDKIQALYSYVSKNIRYVSLSFGLARYQPHSAGEVLANQYGDCKDKHTLLAAMLRAAGIQADAVLIPFTRKLDTSVPSPSQFDHVITAIPDGVDLIWMDSTAEVAPFRLLSAPLRNKSALLVPPDGAGKIVETPVDPPFLSTQRVEIEGQISDLGKLTAKLHYFLRGDNELAVRLAFRRTPETQWKQLGQTIAALDGIHGEVTNVKPGDPSDTQNPFELEIDYSQPNFLDWSSKKAKLALPMLTVGLPNAAADNADPIKLGSPLDITMSLKLTLPSNFAARPPVAVAVARDYAEFKSSYHFADHVLAARRTLSFKMRELPASRTGDYMAFTRAVESDESQALMVENSETGAPAIPPSAKSDELLEAGAAALNSNNPRAAIPLFKRVVELDPKHKQAWNDLGLAQLRLGQFDDAASSFRKQIEVNPYDERAYDYLGIALQQQQKYAEAASAYQKQIEVNPLDVLAHAALGALYLEQHKYAEAVPELDKATILSPDDAGLQVSLGQAYLNTGEKEKALAAFEKGAELSQTPMVWNNVAYALADHNLQLDRAQRYAESAIAAVDASLRNIDLSHVSLDELNQVGSIGTFWDTLGWVYFQKGDLATAERYIYASWALNQHGEVGDHLAQIYEKHGQKDDAIQMYALALAATRPIPETRGRMSVLAGSDSKIDELVSTAKPMLEKVRTLSAGKLLKEDAQADFFLLLSAGTAGSRAARVDAAQFISGSSKLRPFADRLRSLDYGAVFPDDSPTRLVRRGTLSCSATTGECIFTLILPENVRTVN
jgi:Flp pilus assembly protein TadD/transglutaminase-like putative cysteine protease